MLKEIEISICPECSETVYLDPERLWVGHDPACLSKEVQMPRINPMAFTKQNIKDTVGLLGGPRPNDPVNHPSHYTSGNIEVIDFIEDQKLTYNLGNAVKYIARAGKKIPNPREDLKKAQWYLNREIERLG